MLKIFIKNNVKISYCSLLYHHRQQSVISSHSKQILDASKNNILDAIAEYKVNYCRTINVFHSILSMKQRFLMKSTINAADISVLLKQYLKRESRTILRTSNVKSIRSELNFQSVFRS